MFQLPELVKLTRQTLLNNLPYIIGNTECASGDTETTSNFKYDFVYEAKESSETKTDTTGENKSIYEIESGSVNGSKMNYSNIFREENSRTAEWDSRDEIKDFNAPYEAESLEMQITKIVSTQEKSERLNCPGLLKYLQGKWLFLITLNLVYQIIF